jgi:hypothetical protein
MALLPEDPRLASRHDDGQIIQLLAQSLLCGPRRVQEVFDGEERAADVDAVRLLPRFQRELPDGIIMTFISDSGVGNEDIDGPESLDSECDAGSDGFFVGDVTALDVESGITLANGVWDLEWAEVICCYFASLVCIMAH